MKKTSDAIGFFGGSKPVACPNCGKTVNMQMLRSSNGIGAFGISVLNYRHDLFAICPECSALFGVDRKVSKVEARDTGNTRYRWFFLFQGYLTEYFNRILKLNI